jgi:hypothetical protein
VCRQFQNRLWRKLYAFHWILPYPSSGGFTQTTKEGERMWYSITTSRCEVENLEWVKGSEWRWGRKEWKEGEPEGLPEYVGWDKEEWVVWIEGQTRGGVEGGGSEGAGEGEGLES